MFPVHLASGLGREPVLCGPIGVERAEQTVLRDHLVERAKGALGAFLLDEKGRIGLVRGVVHGDDKVPPLPRHPLVRGPVLMQHHARQRPARPLAPVRASACRRPLAPMSLERQADPVVAPRHAVIVAELLPEMPRVEIPITGVEKLQNPRHLVHRRAARRNRPQAAVVKTLRPCRLVTIPPAPERALRHPQDLRRLRLAQPATTGSIINLRELHNA